MRGLLQDPPGERFAVQSAFEGPRHQVRRIANAGALYGRENLTANHRVNQRAVARNPHDDVGVEQSCSAGVALEHVGLWATEH